MTRQLCAISLPLCLFVAVCALEKLLSVFAIHGRCFFVLPAICTSSIATRFAHAMPPRPTNLIIVTSIQSSSKLLVFAERFYRTVNVDLISWNWLKFETWIPFTQNRIHFADTSSSLVGLWRQSIGWWVSNNHSCWFSSHERTSYLLFSRPHAFANGLVLFIMPSFNYKIAIRASVLFVLTSKLTAYSHSICIPSMDLTNRSIRRNI